MKRISFKRGIVFLLSLIIAYIALRFVLSMWGSEAPCEYIFSRSFTLFGNDFTFAVYKFSAGVPFFGITFARTELLLGVVKFIPFLPIISGEGSVVAFDWAEAGILTLQAILVIGILCRTNEEPFETEEESGKIEEEEEHIPDKDICPKCGKRIFGDNVYCENCGAKRIE